MPDPQVSVWIRAKDLASKVVKGFEGKLRSVARVGTSVARDLAAIGVAVGAAVVGLTKLAGRGAKVIAVQRTFNKITGDGTAALKQLRAQTGGLISDYDLMTGLNTAIAVGSAKTVEEFGEMARISQVLGRSLGVDMANALESLNVGIARQSKLRLDNIGILIDVAKVNKEHAATLNKTVAVMTDLEKKDAFRAAAMKEARRLAVELGGAELEAAEASDRFAASVGNLKDRISELAAKSSFLSKFFEGWEGFLFELGGGDVVLREFEEGLARISDASTLNARFQGVSASIGKVKGRLVDLREEMGEFFDFDTAESVEFDALTEQLRELEAERIAVTARQAELRRSARALATVDDEPGVAAIQLERTSSVAQELLDRLAEARLKLADLKIDAALAPAGEEADKATKAIDEITASIGRLQDALKNFGGEGLARINLGVAKEFGFSQGLARTASTEVDPTLGQSEKGRRAISLDTVTRGLDKELDRRNEQLAAEARAAKETADVGPLVVSSFGAMAAAAIEGSELTAQSVIGMFTNILRSLPGVGGLLGSVIGAAGMITGVLFNRGSREPASVKIDKVSPAAAKTLAEANEERPLRITNINVTPEGKTIAQTEYELRRRERRDAVPRFIGGGG